MLKRKVAEANRNPDDFEIIVIIYPSINTMNTEVGKRLAFTGTMEQVGNDIDRLKKMGIGHIILNYNRSQIENDMNAIIHTSKQILTYAK